MFIQTPRFVMRDFQETDRAAFVAYQMDPRYQRLYDFSAADEGRARDLFDLFLAWQHESPRQNFQLGIFDRASVRLLGCAGLRTADQIARTAVFGMELAPENWGRYRLALDVAGTLIGYGFRTLDLRTIVGNTSSGNTQVEKLARWFGAQIVARRQGPDWMTAREWQEIDWVLRRDDWAVRVRRSPRPAH
jgi:ribosomal-protein-alanine N-acetyltransferase